MNGPSGLPSWNNFLEKERSFEALPIFAVRDLFAARTFKSIRIFKKYWSNFRDLSLPSYIESMLEAVNMPLLNFDMGSGNPMEAALRCRRPSMAFKCQSPVFLIGAKGLGDALTVVFM